MKNAILELKQGIDEKTKKLIELKARYNEMVEKICKELNESVLQGILNCKIKSIILPLMADHMLRETLFYLYLQKIY